MEDALAASRDATSAAELARQQAQVQEAEFRNQLEMQLSEFREEAAARDATAQFEQDTLRGASAKQAQELRQALEDLSRCKDACTAAEATAQATEHARRDVVEVASAAEASLGDVREDLRLAQEEIQSVEGHLAEARAALETSQQEAKHRHEAHDVAEKSIQQLSGRVIEMESLLQDAQLRSSQVERDLTDSSQKIEELREVAQVHQGEVAEATKYSGKLQAHADAQEGRLRESLERVAELLDTLETLRSQLDGKVLAQFVSPVPTSRYHRLLCTTDLKGGWKVVALKVVCG